MRLVGKTWVEDGMESLGAQWEGRVMTRQGKKEQSYNGSPPGRGQERLPREVGQVFNHLLRQRDLRFHVENRSSVIFTGFLWSPAWHMLSFTGQMILNLESSDQGA